MISPVITIDGPAGSGKGTLALRLAQRLGWHYLDSGVLYRVLGLLAIRQAVDAHDEHRLAELAGQMQLRFELQANGRVSIYLDDEDVTQAVRTEKAGEMASQVSQHGLVRAALLEVQRRFRKAPGLVTDGRDMGTVVFPTAELKIYLDASADVRAERRLNQLQAMGVDVKLANLVEELKVRDKRDQTRAVAPLKPAADAVVIDTSFRPIDLVFEQVFALAVKKLGISS